jgi:hypothetical protein
MTQRNDGCLSSPIVLIIGLIASVIGIFVFITGYSDIPSIFQSTEPTNVSVNIDIPLPPRTSEVDENQDDLIGFFTNRRRSNDKNMMSIMGLTVRSSRGYISDSIRENVREFYLNEMSDRGWEIPDEPDYNGIEDNEVYTMVFTANDNEVWVTLIDPVEIEESNTIVIVTRGKKSE